jgi:hypothetical protein
MAGKKFNIYLISVVLFMLVLPLVSDFIEIELHHVAFSWLLAGKWLIFWAIGARLFIAGITRRPGPLLPHSRYSALRELTVSR